MPNRSILCISFDGVVSESRRRSLKDAGYEVTATISVSEGMDLLDRKKFDAVILGHRFSTEEKHLVALQPRKRRMRQSCWCAGPRQSPAFLPPAECMHWRATPAFCLRCLDCFPPRPQLEAELRFPRLQQMASES
jgi:hypothetical protein